MPSHLHPNKQVYVVALYMDKTAASKLIGSYKDKPRKTLEKVWSK